MSFRARLTLAVALAVAVAVAATSAITYVLVRNELRGQVDDALRERVSSVRLRVVTDPVTGDPQLDLPPDLVAVVVGFVDEREDEEIGAAFLGGIDGGSIKQQLCHI